MPIQPYVLCLFFCLSFFSIIHLRSAVYHLFSLGKSRTRVKKEEKSMDWVSKALLYGYFQKVQQRRILAQRICTVYWIYLVLIVIGLCILTLSALSSLNMVLFTAVVYIKLIILDIPINLYSFVMTKHNQNGGVTWRWTEES